MRRSRQSLSVRCRTPRLVEACGLATDVMVKNRNRASTARIAPVESRSVRRVRTSTGSGRVLKHIRYTVDMTVLRRMRVCLAIIVVRALVGILRGLSRGGGALPGRVALAIAPALLGDLGRRLPRGVVMITGTNGKTTSAHLLDEVLSGAGFRVVRNDSGANLASGLATALALNRGADVAVLETDEATVPRVSAALAPEVMAVSNFFRDQLDRYGELTTTVGHVRRGLPYLSPSGVAVLNADDPNVADLAASVPRVVYFGLTGPGRPVNESGADGADARRCPACGGALAYDVHQYAHLGSYACAACGFHRPPLDLAVAVYHHPDGQDLELDWHGERWRVPLSLPGTYNAYNAALAAAVALTLGVSPDGVARGLGRAGASFGRMEALVWRGVDVRLALVKNPTGFNQVLETLADDSRPKDAVMLVNDRYADGRDVSWLWDVDFEGLMPRTGIDRIWTGGTRGRDMAVRLKYAGLPPDRVVVVPGPPAAVLAAAVGASGGGEGQGRRLYVLPTYTALLAVRQRLAAEGVVRHFREG